MSNQNKNQYQNQNQRPQMPQEDGQGWFIPAVVGVIAVILIIGGISYARRAPSAVSETATTTDQSAVATTTAATSSVESVAVVTSSSTDGSIVSIPVTISAPVTATALETGYKAYSFERMAEAKAGAKVILFFYSKNSPSAKAIDADIRAHVSEIPSDTLILETLYDESPTLVSWYSVPSAPYFVKIDSKGQPVIGWNSSMTLAEILAYAK